MLDSTKNKDICNETKIRCIDGAEEEAGVYNKVVGEKLGVNQGAVINAKKGNKVLGWIEMLVD